MDVTICALPDNINPHNFPAKLWRLVNNPMYTAICWDSHGEGILIDKELFERQILSPSAVFPDNADAFKTTNFSSFVRQLNLYGFRKAELCEADNQLCLRGNVDIHHFFNSNFKRSHPQLVGSLRRLTANNKAKLEAGEDIRCRPPSKYLRFSEPDSNEERNVKRERFPLLSPSHQESPHPQYPKKAQSGMVHFGTPVPPRYLIRGHGAALSPSVFASDKGIQVSFNQQYPGVASSSNVMHVQPGLQACVDRGKVQYQQGYYSPGYQCYQMKQASQLLSSGLQPGSFLPYGYYQTNHTFSLFCAGEKHNQEQLKDQQEMKKSGINLDTVFQVADEVMQPPSTVCVVKVTTPEKPQKPVFISTPHKCSPSVVKENPSAVRPVVTAVSGSADQVKLEPPEISVVLVPECLPEDAISQQQSKHHTGLTVKPPLDKQPSEAKSESNFVLNSEN